MAGLSSIVNLGYHGTIPERAASIAASGFKGGIGQSSQFLGMNMPSWGGTGKVYTSTPNVASTYGPRQIPLVQSAKQLSLPGGGTPGKTLTEALKNFAKTKFGFETALSPEKATQGMTALERMKGKYPHSQTLKRLLETGTTAIKNPTNWARVLGLPLSALTGILSSTPANADESNMTAEDFQNLALQNQTQSIDPTSKNLFSQHGYEEDDEYDFSGIEGQTAMLGLPQLFGMVKAGMSKKQIMKKVLANQLKEEAAKKIGKKVKPIITGVLTGGAKAGAYPIGAGTPQHHQDVSQGGGYQAPNIRSAPKGVTTSSGMHGGKHYARGGRVSYFDGGILSLWPR